MKEDAKIPLEEITLLSIEECDHVRDRIHELRDHWIPRRPDVPFYTLGAASYLDAADDGLEQYRSTLAESNPILRENFGWLHDRLCEALSRHVGEEVHLDERVALPGFHVFLAHEAFTQPMASLHYDLQYESIDWSDLGEVDHTRHLSITLSLRLPAEGGGLRVWNVNNLEMAKLTIDERRAWLRKNRKPTYHPYEVGKLALHSGHQLHQIAPTQRMIEGDERITLQAHALPVGGRWLCYW